MGEVMHLHMYSSTAQPSQVHIISSEEEDDVSSDTGDEYDSYISASETDSLSLDGSDEETDEQQEASDDAIAVNGDTSDQSLNEIVVRLLRQGASLRRLTMPQWKAYLRLNGLRLSGSKEVCLMRVEEHWRISNENAESLYPRSSFVINCTGDVCKGDVVLFRQKVFESSDKKTWRGKVIGKRTVAGRVVKESYGSQKQQHTFTVEVLWSWGAKKLPPLSPLFVKGRNLYKMKTFRQPWPNEKERESVLMEKHGRGNAARQIRAKNKRSSTDGQNGGKKRLKKTDGASTSRVKPRGIKHASTQRKNTFKTNSKFFKTKKTISKRSTNFKSLHSSQRDNSSSFIPIPPLNTHTTMIPRQINRFPADSFHPRDPFCVHGRQNVGGFGHSNISNAHVPHFTQENQFYMVEPSHYNRFMEASFRPPPSRRHGNMTD